MTKYLGIDYGTKHVGLAVSEHTLATPLPDLTNSEGLIASLQKIIKINQIDTVICGLPEGRHEDEVRTFAAKLETSLGIPVILHPETLSTQEAISKLVEAGASRAKKQNDHSYAACLILEDYLELKNSVN